MADPVRPPGPGWLAPLAVGLLVGATVIAFGVSQRLKREPLVVDRVEYRATGSGADNPQPTVFSPNGDCRHDRMVIRFRTTRTDVADVEIVTPDSELIRRLAKDRFFKRYREHRLVWDGRTNAGLIPPTGRYGVRMTMEELDRRFRLPGWIRLHNFAPQGERLPVIEVLAALVAAGAAALAIADRPSKRRSAAMLVAAMLAPALIAADQWHATQVEELRNSPALLLAAFAVGGAIVAGLAALIYRRPVLLPILIVIALPFRVPLTVGGEDANLLMPLYLVMAAGVLIAVLRSWRGMETSTGTETPTGTETSTGTAGTPSGIAAWMKPLLAASVLLFALGLIYSDDRSLGLQNLCFFLVPFAVIFALMSEVEWNRRKLRIVLIVVLAEALVCAVVGFAEYQFKELLWNETVMRTNDFHVYFRVNSLFWDPNVYGRYLAVAITVSAGSLLWARSRGDMIGLILVTAALWLALMTTFSQSSFIALLAGLAVLVALRWSLRLVLAGIVVLAAGALLFGAFAGGLVKLDLGAINKQTSGRANLVEGGIELFGNRPILGYGSGSFSQAFKDEIAGPNAPVTESHTEPITVAAEQGLVGLALYATLIVSALFALAAGFRAIMPGVGAAFGSGEAKRGPPAARAVILAAFVSVLVHTITYADFLDDPVAWVLMAIGYSLAFPCRDTSAA